MIFDNVVKLSENLSRDQNNFLVCKNAIFGRSGFQNYLKRELEINDGSLDANDVVEVLRPEEEVFKTESMTSLENRPLTKGHIQVDSENCSEVSKGHVYNVHRVDNNLVGDILITDERVAKLVETGQLRELSLGYTQKLVKDEETDTYKFIDIIYNHIALVRKGRAGNAMIIDEESEGEPKMDEKEKIVKDVAYFVGKQLEIEKITDEAVKGALTAELKKEMADCGITVDEEPKVEVEEVAKPTIAVVDEEPIGNEELTHEEKMQLYFNKFDPANYSSFVEYKRAYKANCVSKGYSDLVLESKIKK